MKNKHTMNSLERTTLRNCEKIIAKGVETFREVGEALARIRDEQLFRGTHASFKAYCKEKWNFSDSRARQLIGGAERAATVESVTRVTPSTEAQTRALAKLPKGEQAKAWEEAVDSAGGSEPTMKQVETVVRKMTVSVEPPEEQGQDETGDPKCDHQDDDSERIPEEPSSQPPRKGKEKQAATSGKPPKKFERPAWFKQWDQAIGPACRLVDKIASDLGETGCQSHKTIVGQLDACTEEMAEWMGVSK